VGGAGWRGRGNGRARRRCVLFRRRTPHPPALRATSRRPIVPARGVGGRRGGGTRFAAPPPPGRWVRARAAEPVAEPDYLRGPFCSVLAFKRSGKFSDVESCFSLQDSSFFHLIREVSLSAMIIHGFLTVIVIATIATGAIITGPTTTRMPPQEINHAEINHAETTAAAATASANDVTPIGNIIFLIFDFIFNNIIHDVCVER